ncbi:hypothetical protein FQU76_14305 [Streptomyces qinzhouensis]|uniref:Uncharacterized protein n=1 Tax=Streptomyces qinzhouensis TaxID=2599401 RepID=A0A5B8J6S8_9ACTN|nr:hypothetical protein FQU76_14305 [Streptomyces qinzhouensis]
MAPRPVRSGRPTDGSGRRGPGPGRSGGGCGGGFRTDSGRVRGGFGAVGGGRAGGIGGGSGRFGAVYGWGWRALRDGRGPWAGPRRRGGTLVLGPRQPPGPDAARRRGRLAFRVCCTQLPRLPRPPLPGPFPPPASRMLRG